MELGGVIKSAPKHYVTMSEGNSMFASLQKYLDEGFQNVAGWCGRHLFQAIAACREFQEILGLQAPVAEIGVYHGKFFIGLMLVCGVERGHCAIDVFDMQEFNLDGAGKGDLEKFIANARKAGLTESQFSIHRADSMKLGRKEIDALRENAGQFSFFSVDGCHTAEHTINDLRVATELVDPRGIIFVDDYYNADWPGVQEGIAKLYFNDALRFIPLLYTSNKLFLCHISHHGVYLDYVRSYLTEKYPTSRLKSVRRFGYDTLNVAPDLSKPVQLQHG